MIGAILKSAGKALARAAGGKIYEDIRQDLENDRAYAALKKIFYAMHEQRPSECRTGDVTRMCPTNASSVPNMHDPKRGGTATFHIFQIMAEGGIIYHLQFYDSGQTIYVIRYNEKWERLGDPVEVKPAEAVKELKRALGMGAKAKENA